MTRDAKPPLGRRERKKLQTRQAIVAAAVQLFREQGYRETSVADIMRVADLGVGTFYNYFATKEEMLLYMLESLVRRVKDRLAAEQEAGASSLHLLAAGAEVMANFLEENRYILPIFLAAAEHSIRQRAVHGAAGMEPASGAAGAHGAAQPGADGQASPSELRGMAHSPGFGRMFGEIITAGQAAGEIRTDVPSAVISEMFHSTFQAAAFSQLPLSFAENVALKMRLLLDGIKPQE